MSAPSSLSGLRFFTLLLALSGLLTALPAAERSDAAKKGDASEIVELTPYVVEDDGMTPWLFARMGRTEILSRCSRDVTGALIDRYQRLDALLGLIYPTALQPESEVPNALLIDNRPTAFAAQPLPAQRATLRGISTPAYQANAHRWDHDSQVIRFVLAELDSITAPITITPAYLRTILELRSPALPRWFIEGMVTLHKTLVLPVPSVAERGIYGDYTFAMKPRPKYPNDTVTVRPFVWQSTAETKRMNITFKRAIRATGRMYLPEDFPFLPLPRLLTLHSLDGLSFAEAETFRYQSALLIRWALDPKQQAKRKSDATARPNPQALWQFVADSAVAPFTAGQFSQALGQSLADVDLALRGYLPFACLDSATFTLKPPQTPDTGEPALAMASPLQIAVIKGRFERLETLHAHISDPALAQQFAQQARHTITRSQPRERLHVTQLAELGLLEVDVGNDPVAQPLLTAAAQARVAHPRVYLELARIEYNQLIKAQADWTRSTDETARIEQLLHEGIGQRPALPGAYELLFNLWLHRKHAPTPDDLQLIQQGTRLFSRHFRILYAATLLHSTHGDPAGARLLLEHSLSVFPSGPEQARLLQLKKIIGATAVN